MNEMIAGSDQVKDTSVSNPVVEAESSNVLHETSEAKPERTFTQSEVDKIAGRVRQEAAERYGRTTQVEQPKSIESQTSHLPLEQQREEMRRLVAEETQRHISKLSQDEATKRGQQDANRLAQEFYGKLSAGKEKYQDFDQVFGDVDYSEISDVVYLANKMDNTLEVMRELLDNPTKMGAIRQLPEKLAERAMRKLSDSIKENTAAANTKLPKAPLNQLRPSHTGIGNANAGTSVTELRGKYKV